MTLGNLQRQMTRSNPKETKSTADFVQFLSKITWNSSRCSVHAILCLRAKSLSHVWFFVITWTLALQAPLSLGFSRQGYWSRLPFPSPGDLLTQGSNFHPLSVLHCTEILYSLSHRGFVALAFPVNLCLFFSPYSSNWDDSITKGSSWVYEAHAYNAELFRPEEEGQEGWEKHTREAKALRAYG